MQVYYAKNIKIGLSEMGGNRTTSYLPESLRGSTTIIGLAQKRYLQYSILQKTTYVDLVQSVFDIEKRNTKRKVSSETTITRIEPAPIRKKKIGRVCYYIASINGAILVKVVVQLRKCFRLVTYPFYFFAPPFKINLSKVRYCSLLKYISTHKEPLKIHIELGKFMNL